MPTSAAELTSAMIAARQDASTPKLRSHYEIGVWTELMRKGNRTATKEDYNCAATPLEGYQNFRNMRLAEFARAQGFFNVSTHHDTLRVCWKRPEDLNA